MNSHDQSWSGLNTQIVFDIHELSWTVVNSHEELWTVLKRLQPLKSFEETSAAENSDEQTNSHV